MNGEVIRRTSKASSKTKPNHWMVKTETGEELDVDFNQIEWRKKEAQVFLTLVPRELHGRSEVKEAKIKELGLLSDFDIYEEVKKEEMARGGELLSSTWVVSEKEGKEGEVVTKARLCARGFEEIAECRRDSPTAMKMSLRMLFMISANQGWQVEAVDSKSAFLQGDPLERLVYLQPPKEYKPQLTNVKVVWRLKKALYGLGDAPRSWYLRVHKELTSLGCVRTQLDNAIYVYRVQGKLAGILGLHVDDFLYCGLEQFHTAVINSLLQAFVMGEVERRRFSYVGWQLEQSKAGQVTVSQEGFLKNLEDLDVTELRGVGKEVKVDQDFQHLFRAAVGSINWVSCNTRPDLAYEVMELSTKFGHATVQDLRQASRLVKKAREQGLSLKFKRLGPVEDLKVVMYGDASHASLPDKVSSCEGRVILVVGQEGRCAPLAWACNKIKRVVRSPLAAETMAMMDGIDEALLCKCLLEEIIGLEQGDLTLAAVTDSKSLEDAVTGSGVMKDKRCMIDMAALRQGLERKEYVVAWRSGSEQLADSLTKRGASGEALRNVLESGNCGLVFSRED